MMRRVALLFGVVIATAAMASQDPAHDPDVRDTLQAMHYTSTWWHPDLWGMTHGMQAYAKHQYATALKDFEYGARYADKLSQLCLGLMYLNGKGAAKDPVAALAWFDLAAERGYPQFVATRDALVERLSYDQLERAETLREKLTKRYGDAVAKHRMAVQLRLGTMDFGGSHVGFESSANSELVFGGPRRCGRQLIIGGHAFAQIGCSAMHEFFARKDNWEPKQYFAARDREWMPLVKVGPITDVSATGSGSKHAGKRHADQDEPDPR